MLSQSNTFYTIALFFVCWLFTFLLKNKQTTFYLFWVLNPLFSESHIAVYDKNADVWVLWNDWSEFGLTNAFTDFDKGNDSKFVISMGLNRSSICLCLFAWVHRHSCWNWHGILNYFSETRFEVNLAWTAVINTLKSLKQCLMFKRTKVVLIYLFLLRMFMCVS